jgi:hypothetical protein
VFRALFHSVASSHRDYTEVRAPCLFLYASAFFPAPHDTDADAAAAHAFEQVADTFRDKQIERVRHEVNDATIERVPEATHMAIGVRDPARIAARIRAFLA